ncbi:MAG: hypothetical protein IIW77_04135 [Bacteroidaceae bacterium]|nr:hypothetical protein [Bacteroidaceae bacterium]
MSKEKKKEKKGGFIHYLMGGDFLTSNIFTKNALLLGMIVLYSFFYVSNRYQYEKELVRIDKLTKRRNEIRNNLLTKKNEFQDVYKNLDKRLSDFEKPTPYIINKNKQ